MLLSPPLASRPPAARRSVAPTTPRICDPYGRPQSHTFLRIAPPALPLAVPASPPPPSPLCVRPSPHHRYCVWQPAPASRRRTDVPPAGRPGVGRRPFRADGAARCRARPLPYPPHSAPPVRRPRPFPARAPRRTRDAPRAARGSYGTAQVPARRRLQRAATAGSSSSHAHPHCSLGPPQLVAAACFCRYMQRWINMLKRRSFIFRTSRQNAAGSPRRNIGTCSSPRSPHARHSLPRACHAAL